MADFTTTSGRSRALFSKNGALLYNIRYSTEKDLPGDVYQQVKSKYFNHLITYAIQVTIGKQVAWIVSLKEEKDYLVLKIVNDEMEIMQQYHE